MRREHKHVDFVISIDEEKGRLFSIEYSAPQGGSGSEPRLEAQEFPYLDSDLENTLLKLDNARLRHQSTLSQRHAVIPSATAPLDQSVFHEFGYKLYKWVLGNETAESLYRGAMTHAQSQKSILRVQLRVRAPSLSLVPWEFLCDATKRVQPLALFGTPIVRTLNVPDTTGSDSAFDPPLRILVMLSTPQDLDHINAEAERALLSDLFEPLQEVGLVSVEWVHGGSLHALEERLLDLSWNVFHFIGHGGVDSLALVDPSTGCSKPLSADKLAPMLGRAVRQGSLRLVFLNTCEGAKTDGKSVYSGTASHLIDHGVPAVLAMQFAISDRAAVRFGNQFYKALLNGHSVDMAVNYARTTIFNDWEKEGIETEWATPALFLSVDDCRLFSPEDKLLDARLRDAGEAGIRAFDQQDWEIARRKLKAVTRLSDNPEAHKKLNVVKERLLIQQRYDRGLSLEKKGDYEEARKLFVEVKDHPFGDDYPEVEKDIALCDNKLKAKEQQDCSGVFTETLLLEVNHESEIIGELIRFDGGSTPPRSALISARQVEELYRTMQRIYEGSLSGQEHIESFGSDLYRALFSTELEELLLQGIAEAREHTHRHLRVSLSVSSLSGKISELPFELMRSTSSDVSQRDLWLGASRRFSFSRHVNREVAVSRAPLQEKKLDTSLRILLAVADPTNVKEALPQSLSVDTAGDFRTPRGDRAPGAQLRSKRSVSKCIGLAEPVSTGLLEDEIDQFNPNVLHLVVEVEKRDGRIAFRFADENGPAERVLVSADDLVGAIDDGNAKNYLKLVVIHATAETMSFAHTPMTNMAADWIKKKLLPAVLIVPVRLEDATFFTAFYKALENGAEIDTAIQVSRLKLGKCTRWDRCDFAIPVLFSDYPEAIVTSRGESTIDLGSVFPKPPSTRVNVPHPEHPKKLGQSSLQEATTASSGIDLTSSGSRLGDSIFQQPPGTALEPRPKKTFD